VLGVYPKRIARVRKLMERGVIVIKGSSVEGSSHGSNPSEG